MKLNLREYVGKLNDVAKESVNSITNTDDEKYESFNKDNVTVLVHADTGKMKTGNLSVNVSLIRTDKKKKQVYSIYIVEAKSGQVATIIVDSSAYNHSLLFSNISENSVEKSFEFITKIIQHGTLNLFKKPHISKKNNRYKKDNTDMAWMFFNYTL